MCGDFSTWDLPTRWSRKFLNLLRAVTAYVLNIRFCSCESYVIFHCIGSSLVGRHENQGFSLPQIPRRAVGGWRLAVGGVLISRYA